MPGFPTKNTLKLYDIELDEDDMEGSKLTLNFQKLCALVNLPLPSQTWCLILTLSKPQRGHTTKKSYILRFIAYRQIRLCFVEKVLKDCLLRTAPTCQYLLYLPSSNSSKHPKGLPRSGNVPSVFKPNFADPRCCHGVFADVISVIKMTRRH